MATEKPIQLDTKSVYHLNDGINYKISQYNQQEVSVRFIEDGKLKEKKMDMMEFLKSEPVNVGRL